MGEQFRRLVDEELSTQRPPPLDGLVGRAVVDGRRIRRTQAFRTCAAAAAAVFLLAGGVATASRLTRSDGSPDVVATAGPDRALATPAALLELLTRLLPAGPTSGFAGEIDEDGIRVQVYLDRGSGPRLVRLRVTPRPGPTPPCLPESASPLDTALPGWPPVGPADPTARPTPEVPLPGACQVLPDGSYLREFNRPEDCVEGRGVDVFRPDGGRVRIALSNCVTPLALSTSEAVA